MYDSAATPRLELPSPPWVGVRSSLNFSTYALAYSSVVYIVATTFHCEYFDITMMILIVKLRAGTSS